MTTNDLFRNQPLADLALDIYGRLVVSDIDSIRR